jgi:hypothetical protein
MLERSVCFRDRADKCLWHANHLTDSRTQVEPRKLATEYIEEYIERAVEIESKPPLAPDFESEIYGSWGCVATG